MAEQPKQLGDYDVALKMRDIVETMVKNVMDRERPRGKRAMVIDWDRDNLKAEVLFPGDTQTVQASFPKNLQPKRRAMDDGVGNAQGDIVHVEGKPGSYQIVSIGDGAARSDEQTLLNPLIVTMQGIEEALLGMLPQPGDCRFTFREGIAGGGTILPGNWVLCDNSLVTRSAPFDQAWVNLGSPTNGTDGTNWRLEDGRDRAPFGASGAGYVTLRGDDGQAIADRGPLHTHIISTGGTHTHSHGHTHDISSTNHSGITNASYAETGIKNLVQQINGSHNGSHAHGGNTGQPGDATTGSNGDHNHSGETGNGGASTKKLGWKGVYWLMKL